MTLGLFINLAPTTLIGLLILSGLTRIPWIQQYSILFWLITVVSIIGILIASVIV